MIELRIDGLACGGCVKAVEKAIATTDPAAHAQVDLASGTARIETARPRAEIVAAIEAAGYDLAQA